MNKIEALRKEADLREMCEGTSVQWWKCIRSKLNGNSPIHMVAVDWLETLPYDTLEFALAIIEDKPVFEGDTPYHRELNDVVFVTEKVGYNILHGTLGNRIGVVVDISQLSWTKPKPTVMVELLVEDAEYMAKWVNHDRLSSACRKALEELKGAEIENE